MKRIQISGIVAQALATSKKSADEILREVLGIENAFEAEEGVVFPAGTSFMAWYKDRPYWGTVKNGGIEIMGETFNSVSAAAVKITKRPTNGWDFWQCKLPGARKFINIDELRQKH